jgi:hypothetical protein
VEKRRDYLRREENFVITMSYKVFDITEELASSILEGFFPYPAMYQRTQRRTRLEELDYWSQPWRDLNDQLDGHRNFGT